MEHQARGLSRRGKLVNTWTLDSYHIIGHCQDIETIRSFLSTGYQKEENINRFTRYSFLLSKVNSADYQIQKLGWTTIHMCLHSGKWDTYSPDPVFHLGTMPVIDSPPPAVSDLSFIQTLDWILDKNDLPNATASGSLNSHDCHSMISDHIK